MITSTTKLLSAAAILLSLAMPLYAQDKEPAQDDTADISPADLAAMQAHEKFMSGLSWLKTGKGTLGSRGEIEIPEGYRYIGSSDASKLMKYYGNLSDSSELGVIAPDDLGWFIVFKFDDIGYVKDDEKDKLNASEILEQLKKGQEQANKQLVQMGQSTLTVLGWHTPPFYNEQTKNLEWAIRLSSSDGGQVLNYNTKILGRRGVLNVVLVCDESLLSSVIPQQQKLLSGFAYKQEESYAAYTKGDKIAEYGLIGLIAGGGLLVAAKSGLLAKLWKPIAIGLVAVGAFIKKLFTRNPPQSI